jgi:tripartite-type tricarboxylate transporter receptor subunit TctC
VTSKNRWPGAPEIPALAETLPGYEVTAWFGLLGARGMPAEAVATANAALNAKLREEGPRERLLELGGTPAGGTPQDYTTLILAEHRKWGDVIRQAGIKLE